MNSLRLGLYYHTPILKAADGLYLPGYFGRFVEALAGECRQVVCFFHEATSAQVTMCDYRIQASNVTWISLGAPRSAPFRTFFPSRITRLAKPAFCDLDLLLLRGPSPLLPGLARSAGALPLALLLVGDYLAGIDSLPQPFWRKELIRLWAWWNTFQQLQVARHSLTFVNSQRLFDDLRESVPNLCLTRTTTLSQEDGYFRDDTCSGEIIRLLYAGRFTVSKGLFDILIAMKQLIGQGENVVLDLVGWAEKGEEDIVDRLMAFAKEEKMEGRIFNHGYKAVGSELFEYYKQADIYVMASQSSSEGFPRTIWEAMAHSVPVIATSVGSIPDFIGDCAIIVKPYSPQELADAAIKLIKTPDLRQRMIKTGRDLAKENTFELQTKKLVEEIKKWVACCDK